MGRERLADQLQNMVNFELLSSQEAAFIEPQRLVKLMRQAVAYQVESSYYHPLVAPKIGTLLQDYQPLVIPNTCTVTLKGHTANVKCVNWVGAAGNYIATGSSDNSVKIWDTLGRCCATTVGLHGRVWDVQSTQNGQKVIAGTGNGALTVWDFNNDKLNLSSKIPAHVGDVYALCIHPDERHSVSCGYDKTVKLIDLERSTTVTEFLGHQLSVSDVTFNPYGNLVVSGSKDNTVKFWDINSGLCIKSLTSHLGEVTSVEMNDTGLMLLTSSKDNSIRVWDIRMSRPVHRYKGHNNTSRNFIRARYAGTSELVVSGSEDGLIHVWNAEGGESLQRLHGHAGVVYSVAANREQGMWASCSDDFTAKLWKYSSESLTH